MQVAPMTKETTQMPVAKQQYLTIWKFEKGV